MIRTIAVCLLLAGCAAVPSGGPVTAYEGARIITGDGRVIDNGTLLVEGARIARVGNITTPSGATRVNLAGETVMPMIVDTHVHLTPTREGLIRDLRQRAYYGVSGAMSLGTDGYELLGMRNEEIPGAARFRSAGRGITMQEPGRTTVPYWINSEADARKAVAELASNKVDIVKIWVDTRDGKYKKLSPELYGAIIDEAHKRGLRVTAHIFDLEDAKGLIRAGVDALAHGLISYGPSYPQMVARAADYIGRIAKGAKPGDMPIEQPGSFELVLNARTAKALGLAIPQQVLLRADPVID